MKINELLLGLDLGTTGCKSALFTADGRSVSASSADYPMISQRPGWAEQDPSVWWSAAVDSIRRCLERDGVHAASVRAVGISGQMHGCVLLDRDCNPIRPCILWCDQRTAPQCLRIEESLGPDLLRDQACNPALAGFTAPKLLWLRDNEPEGFRRLSTLLLPKDFIRYKLTGEIGTEPSDASGTMLFDVRRGEWSKEITGALDIDPDILPPLMASAEIAGRVNATAAGETGLLEGTPVVAGGADNACSALGMGVIEERTVGVSIGSSGTVVAPTTRPLVDKEMRLHTFQHAVPDSWYLMGVMLSAGLSLRWFRDNLGGPEVSRARSTGVDPYELLTGMASRIAPGSGGLLFLPYMSGERCPHKDPDARGVFFGLDLTKGRGHMVRAIMEGVCFGLKDSMVIMGELGASPLEVIASGGGARSSLWLQTQADIFGKPVVTVSVTDTALLGAAMLAGLGISVFANPEEAVSSCVHKAEVYYPEETNGELYGVAYETFKGLYPALKELFRSA